MEYQHILIIADRRRAAMSEFATGPLARFYDYGKAAAQCGEPKHACPYRRPDRANAWVRGWYAGETERLRLEAWRERRGIPHLPVEGVS